METIGIPETRKPAEMHMTVSEIIPPQLASLKVRDSQGP